MQQALERIPFLYSFYSDPQGGLDLSLEFFSTLYAAPKVYLI